MKLFFICRKRVLGIALFVIGLIAAITSFLLAALNSYYYRADLQYGLVDFFGFPIPVRESTAGMGLLFQFFSYPKHYLTNGGLILLMAGAAGLTRKGQTLTSAQPDRHP